MAHWDDARRSEAFALLVDGNSAFEAAKLLNVRYPGQNYTRNSIIGQVSRNGDATVRHVMRSRCGPSRAQSRTTKIVREAVRKPRAKTLQAKLAEFLKDNAKPLPPPAEADIARVSFNDMNPRLHCRFIPGDPSVAFKPDKPIYCGLTPFPGTSYCAAHAAKCFDTERTVVSLATFRARHYEAATDKEYA